MAYDLPSCEECKTTVYEGHKTGRAYKKTSNYRESYPRLLEIMPTPCHECPKLTARDRRNNPVPLKATEATDRHYQALQYYRMMKFDRNGILPYDSLTLVNNVAIAQAEEEAASVNQKSPIVVLGGK